MNKYDVHISEPWFSQIRLGQKKAEGRPNRKSFAQMQKGDILRIFNDDSGQEYLLSIVDKKYYKTFEEMLKSEGLHNVLPDPKVKTIEDGVAVYRQWYSQEVENEFGVVAIKIVKINPNVVISI